MDRFEKAVLDTIRRYHLFSRNDRVLVALSGGPDSVALLAALTGLREVYALEVLAGHVNHQLRGKDSHQDEEFVGRVCHEFGVPLHVKRLPTRQQASKAKRNLEDFARNQRYGFLFQIAKQKGAVVATGHNLDDQAATFLMKLIRGAGTAGLSGIHLTRVNVHDSQAITVVRPLLETTRCEILGYLGRRDQLYRIDSTNQDLSLERNWVRQHLLPTISAKLNPELLHTLARTAALIREIHESLMRDARQAWVQCATRDLEQLTLSIRELLQLTPILQKQVIRLAVEEYRGNLQGITLRHIQSILDLAHRPSGRQSHLPGDLKVQREFDELRFLSKSAIPAFCYELAIPGEIYAGEVGKRVIARKVSGEKKRGMIRLPCEGTSLKVRNRRPGDRYSSRLGSGDKKLKRLLQEKRVPKSRRDQLLVLQAGDRILWVEGFPPPFLTPISAEVIEIEIRNETLGQENASK